MVERVFFLRRLYLEVPALEGLPETRKGLSGTQILVTCTRFLLEDC